MSDPDIPAWGRADAACGPSLILSVLAFSSWKANDATDITSNLLGRLCTCLSGLSMQMEKGVAKKKPKP